MIFFFGFHFANSLAKYKLISDVQESCFMFNVIEIHVENVGRINQQFGKKARIAVYQNKCKKLKADKKQLSKLTVNYNEETFQLTEAC